MYPLHILVSAVNILCGLLLIALLLGLSAPYPVWAVLSDIGGYFANAFAVLVSAVVGVVFIAKLVLGGARPFLVRHWLGLFNGCFVIVCWSLFFGIAKLVAT